MTQISLDKQYETAVGCEVEIYKVDGGGQYPVIGAYKHGGTWYAGSWNRKGQNYESGKSNYYGLVEVKPERKIMIFVNRYTNQTYTSLPVNVGKEMFDAYYVTLSEENKVT